MSDRGIWGIRIFLTIVLAIVCIAAWSIGSLFYIDAGECYYINNPNKEVLRAIKSELNIEKMPEDLVISKCSSTLPFFDSDEVISIDILSNYSEEKWREIIDDRADTPGAYGYDAITFSKTANIFKLNGRYCLRIKKQDNKTALNEIVSNRGIYDEGYGRLINIARAIIYIVIVFLPLYPYDRIMYFIKNLKYRRMDLN